MAISPGRLLLLAALWIALLSTTMAKTSFDKLSRHVLLPAFHGRFRNQCYDSQIHHNYFVGEEWSHPYSGCKLNKCIEMDGHLYIDKYSCPNVLRRVDRRQMVQQKLYCRHAFGDRRQPFPACCPQLVCKHYNEAHKLVPLPADQYPWAHPH